MATTSLRSGRTIVLVGLCVMMMVVVVVLPRQKWGLAGAARSSRREDLRGFHVWQTVRPRHDVGGLWWFRSQSVFVWMEGGWLG